MWWNCFNSRSNTSSPSRKLRRRREGDEEARRETNSANHHAHTISFAEVNDPGTTLPMPSEDVVNEKFTKIVVSRIRTSFNIVQNYIILLRRSKT